MSIYGLDITYAIFVLPAILLGFIAQMLVKSTFAKYSRVESRKGVTGAAAAQFLLKKNGIDNVKIAHIRGHLTDNYNPVNRVLSLSDSTFQSKSVAAIGVAAHETGHAIQHAKHYPPLAIRRAMVPMANFGSSAGPLLVIAGIALNAGIAAEEYLTIFWFMTNVGVVLYAISVLFYLITLPVEFNASRRALKILKNTGVFDKEEIRATKKVLRAAALTYVASALTAVGNLLAMIARIRGRRRK